ncbi:MAG: ATP-binding protein [bacterium]|nr:ATP-binding protein [bacterium]
MNDELIKTLKYLRMPNLLSRWDEYLATAQKGKLSSVRLLEQIVEDELQCRQNNACERRLKQAKIPEALVMETFPFDRQKKLDKKKVLSIYDAFDFMDKSQNIVWLGPTGCGKTGLATSFLVEAIRRGAKGRHVFFPELLDELYASVADHSEEAVIKRYVSYDCLLIDSC